MGTLLSRRSIRSIRKGNASEVKQGSKNPFYGKHHTAEARKKMGERRHSMETRTKMSEAKQGIKHPRWKGGISSKQAKIRGQIEFKIWRNAVFVRDNWTCQECGEQGGRLVAHHIKSFANYPELRLAIDNGKTLCLECHKLTNNFSGRDNSNEGLY